MKIGVRLALNFGALALMMVILIVIAVTSISNLKDISHDLASDKYPKTVWANNIVDAINDAARALRNLVIVRDNPQFKGEIAANLDRIKSTGQDVGKNIDSLKSRIKTDKGVMLLNELAKTRQDYYDARIPILEMLEEKRFDEASVALLEDLRKPQNDYINATRAIIAYYNA